MPETVVSKDGTTIAYEKSGTGPALVLVDGALCSREMGPGRDLAKELADRYTVYVYDRRGRGDSGDTQPYAVHREIEDLEAVMAASGEVPYVAGQSSGAALALEAAASGIPMKKLASYEAPYIGFAPVKGAVPDHTAILEKYLSDGNVGGAVGHFMVKMVGAPAFVPVMMRLMPKVWNGLKANGMTLPNDSRVMDGFTAPTTRLATITVPTLVMGGSKGKANMKAAVQAVADAVPGSIHETLEGQTHQVRATALAPALAAFFV
ncbi:MAG: alpha/beta hydrolase [Microbacteriaceae bacterium]|nr:alpha/beta hydrolase [Microbacteriaceae bacterium]